MPVQNAFINATDPPKNHLQLFINATNPPPKSPTAIYTTAEASLPPYEVITTQEVAAVFYDQNSSYKLPMFVRWKHPPCKLNWKLLSSMSEDSSKIKVQHFAQVVFAWVTCTDSLLK